MARSAVIAGVSFLVLSLSFAAAQAPELPPELQKVRAALDKYQTSATYGRVCDVGDGRLTGLR